MSRCICAPVNVIGVVYEFLLQFIDVVAMRGLLLRHKIISGTGLPSILEPDLD